MPVNQENTESSPIIRVSSPNQQLEPQKNQNQHPGPQKDQNQQPEPQKVQNHQQTTNPSISEQNPQLQHNIPANQGNEPPQLQPNPPKHPTEDPKSTQDSKFYHQHREIDYKITADDLKNFRVAFTSEDPEDKHIKSIDFTPNGMGGLYNTNNTIKFIWFEEGSPQEHVINVVKYGSGICRFLNPYDRIIHTSMKVDDSIRLYNSAKNGYDMFFKGHAAEVIELEVFPLWNSNFVSASRDNTVKFWNIRQNSCIKSMAFKKCPIIACHPKDLQVAVAYATGTSTYVIELYDLRILATESAVTTFYFEDQEFQWKIMKYSKNGKYLMVNTNNTLTIVIDVEAGAACHRLYGRFMIFLGMELIFDAQTYFWGRTKIETCV
jgi:WD40 repeat protein